MNILVLGAGGMAGHIAAVYFVERGHRVTGLTKSPLPYCDNIIGSALDKNLLKDALTGQRYDAVINCIGILNREVDQNMADGIYLNSYLPHYIEELLQSTATKFIHLSTDCVFSGKGGGGYREDSVKDSDSFYGITKALGETNDPRNVTFRTSIIGPDRNEGGTGLMNWFLKQDKPVNGYTTAIWSGVTTLTLAKAIEKAVIDDIGGIYHLVNNEPINKYELLRLFNRHLRKEPIDIAPSEALRTDKSLINSRVDFDFSVPSYERMIIETKEWIDAHEELYPHYRGVSF